MSEDQGKPQGRPLSMEQIFADVNSKEEALAALKSHGLAPDRYRRVIARELDREAIWCTECGVQIESEDTHNRFHARLDEIERNSLISKTPRIGERFVPGWGETRHG